MTPVKWPDGTDGLVDEILTDAYGDDEQLWAFRQAFEDDVHVPADAFVIGEPVEMLEIDYDGNTRRGLTARCRREDGSEYVVAASEVSFPEGSVGARYVAAYRRWLGIEPPAPQKVPQKVPGTPFRLCLTAGPITPPPPLSPRTAPRAWRGAVARSWTSGARPGG